MEKYLEEKLSIKKLMQTTRQSLGEDIFKSWLPGLDLEASLFSYIFYLNVANKIKPNQAKTKLSHQILSFRDNGEFSDLNDLYTLFDSQLDPYIEKNWHDKLKRFFKKLSTTSTNAIYLIGSGREQTVATRLGELFLSCAVPNLQKSIIAPKKFKIVAKNLKAKSDLSSNFAREFGDIKTLAMVSKPSVSKELHSLNRLRWYRLVESLMALPELKRAESYQVMAGLIYVISLAYIIEGLRVYYAPKYIFGAFEKSAYCSLLSAVLNRDHATRCNVINIQHGVLGEDALIENLNVSAFFIWDKATYKSIVERGDFPHERLYVIGRESDVTCSPKGNQILRLWKQDSKLFLACLQPLSAMRQKAFINPLLSYMRTNPDVRLLIRTHPRQSEEDIALWWPAVTPELESRVKVTAASEFSLNDCLDVADLVCSDYSTALIDACYAGRPTLSIYTEAEFDSSVCAYFQALGIPMLYCEAVTSVAISEAMKDTLAKSHHMKTIFSEQLLKKALISIKEAAVSNSDDWTDTL